MPSRRGFRSLIFYTFFFFFLLHSATPSAVSQVACRMGPLGNKIITSVQVVKHTIHIIASVTSNTTLQINTNLHLPVSEAPTSLDVVTTYDTESTYLSLINAYSTSNARWTPPINYGFNLMLVPTQQLSPKRRRQANSMMSYNGRETTSCAQTSILSLLNGQLFATFANGTIVQFSASVGEPFVYMVPTSTPGNITTDFSLSGMGDLLWTNDAFFNGGALFCVLPSGMIVAVLQEGARPDTCHFMDLTVSELNACPVATSSATLPLTLGMQPSSGPSGPSGPTGPQGLSGLSGQIGATGPSGPPGLSGLSGAAGATGSQGLSGLPGLSGVVGATGSQGLSGLSGAAGATGPQGLSGLSGAMGPTGATGPQGLSGLSGAVGATGPQGLSGLSGATGPTGVMGPQGLSGLSGAIGATGPQGSSGLPGATGPTGATGPQGLSGLPGATGPTGTVGPQGLSGAVGATGPQGLSGLSGAVGATGSQGLSGLSGAVGATGPTGATGPQGLSGLSGAVGATGLTGATGLQGLSGLSGAVGATGPTGATGPQGLSGLSGVVGATGPQGLSGLSGAVGATGPTGAAGPQGATGAQGLSGLPGATGSIGPSGAPGIAYAYLGCFLQATISSAITGHVLSRFVATYTSSANAVCSSYCSGLNYNFYGTVNVAGPPATVDCYCGDVLNFITLVNLGTGPAPDNNCALCNGGPAPAGQCGIQTSSTIAIYARAF